MTDEQGGGDDVDPITGAAVAKALATGGAEGAKETGRLLSRVLGPAADELGAALARFTAYRVGNVQRIAENASSKGGGGEGREVPPRVARSILDDGSYSDDELIVEYLGGVLAASSTPGGKDDRAIVWSSLISTMSSLQLRAHFLLYREWAELLRGRGELALGMDTDRQQAKMFIEINDFVRALCSEHGVDWAAALPHSIDGLIRHGLLHTEYAYGGRSTLGERRDDSPYDMLVMVTPSVAGFELYGWAQGLAGLAPHEFVHEARSFAEDSVPRLTTAVLPFLPPVPTVEPTSDA